MVVVHVENHRAKDKTLEVGKDCTVKTKEQKGQEDDQTNEIASPQIVKTFTVLQDNTSQQACHSIAREKTNEHN